MRLQNKGTLTNVSALILVASTLIGCSDKGASTPDAVAEPSVDIARTAEPSVALNEAVDFSLTDMSGAVRHASEWDGQPKLINFWATWCAPCRREIPLLKETQARYTDLNLQVIGIAVDFAEDVAAYAEHAEFNYPILVGQEDAMAVAETSGVEFIGLPFTMVVAASGELIKTHVGEIVEAHIDAITDVLAQLERKEIDLDGARAALGNL